jgi:hypothetical protein
MEPDELRSIGSWSLIPSYIWIIRLSSARKLCERWVRVQAAPAREQTVLAKWFRFRPKVPRTGTAARLLPNSPSSSTV